LLRTAAHRVAAVAVVLLCAVVAFDPPAEPSTYDNDQYLYQQIVDRMRDGDDFYTAAAGAYRSVGGAVETPRAFRPPTAFLVWRWIPTDLLWPAYVALVCGLTGLLLLAATRAPIAVPLVVVYLISLGRVSVEYLFVELWTVPLTAGCLLAYRQRRERLAAGLAVAATAVRELAAVLIVGGLGAAWRARRTVRTWLVAVVVASALYALHVLLLQDHLSAAGTEERLVGTGSLQAVAEMTGFQLPASGLVGPALWALALAGLWRRERAEGLLLAPLLLLPLIGLVVDRPYWGAMVVPFEILLAAELLSGLRPPARSSRTGA
jgi:hypothetical protein